MDLQAAAALASDMRRQRVRSDLGTSIQRGQVARGWRSLRGDEHNLLHGVGLCNECEGGDGNQ